MNFLKLLDPYALDKNDISSAGRQQQQAHKRFPELVEHSNLVLYREEMAVNNKNLILIGVAASYKLADLRFLDMINQFIGINPPIHTVCVLNIDETQLRCESLFGFDSNAPTPYAKIVHEGNLVSSEYGHLAIESVFKSLKIPLHYSEVWKNLNPPAMELLEDY